MQRRIIATAAVTGALVVAGAGAAIAGSAGDDGDEQATGAGADRARAAALKITGGGTANAVERDGEDGATWEVEITQPDGETVDVRLDDRYRLVVVERDIEREPETGADDD
jgi:uncharacterized membrane protein YkoI